MIALWYASRATGLAALLMLTAVVVTGAAGSARFAASAWPRFATASLHRNLTLLCLAFLTIHISTAVIDPYVPIAWADAVVPFISAYHPVWVGLGALALDLLAALVLSSLARPAIDARAWRVLHWVAYACWPVAVAHGLGVAGADSRLMWVRILTGMCVAAVVAAVAWRARARHPDNQTHPRHFPQNPRQTTHNGPPPPPRHPSPPAALPAEPAMTRPQPCPPAEPTAPPASDPRRLLAGWHATGAPADYRSHHTTYGPAPIGHYRGRTGRARLIATITAAGLRGRGGAGFPTGTKLTAVAEHVRPGRTPVVVVNACEGDPASDKDHALLTVAPHLVLDGAALAAHATRAEKILFCIHRGDPLAATITAAAADRPESAPRLRVVEIPDRYVASQETALIHYLNAGDARPTTTPPRPHQRGVAGRATLVDNPETLAHLALIARYGPDWFGSLGTPDSPGTTLVTLAGAVSRPGVYETPLGVPLGQVLRLAGEPTQSVQAVLVGGHAGGWLPLSQAARTPLTHTDLAAAGAALGVAALTVLPARACGLTETAHMIAYLAGESAAQCGPCMFGLPALAADLHTLALGAPGTPAVLARLKRLMEIIPGRGACAHPDGTTRLAISALRTFSTDLQAHLAGRPCPSAGRPHLPTPAQPHPSGDWR